MVATVSHNWSDRVNELLDALQAPERGRRAEIARITGLSGAAITKALDRGTPLRLNTMETLSTHIAEQFARAGRHVPKSDVLHFLMGEGPSPLLAPPTSTNPAPLSTQTVGPALLLLNEVAKGMGMNIFTDLSNGIGDTIINRINSVAAQGIPIDSQAMRQVVTLYLDRARRNEPL